MSGYIGSKTSVTLVDGYTQAEADAAFVQDPNGAITVSGSNVGIGTDSPSEELSVASNISATNLYVTSGGDTSSKGISGGFKHGGTNSKSLVITADPDNVGGNTTMQFHVDATEAMRIDAAGRVTMPYQPAFDVAYSGSGYSVKNPVIFDVAYSNVGGHYSTSTGRFTAPVSGSYLFYTAFIKNGTAVARRRFEKNGTNILGGRELRIDSGQSYGENGTMQATIYLNAGDYVTVAHNAGTSYGTTNYDYFGGYLIG